MNGSGELLRRGRDELRVRPRVRRRRGRILGRLAGARGRGAHGVRRGGHGFGADADLAQRRVGFRLDRVGHAGESDALRRLSPLALRRLCRGEFRFPQHVIAEHDHRAGHLADFVPAASASDGGVEVPRAEARHARLEAEQRPDDAAGHNPSDGDRDQHQDADHRAGGARHAPESVVDVGHVLGRCDHHVPRREAAHVSDLRPRGFIGALGKGVGDRALSRPFGVRLSGDLQHYGRERQTVRILQPAHVLADQRRIAAVHDTKPGLGVVDEGVVRMALEPHSSARGDELPPGFVGAQCPGLDRVLIAVGHAPDGIDDRMRFFGPLGHEFGTGDRQYRDGDEHHAQHAHRGHGDQPGDDRPERENRQERAHDQALPSRLPGRGPENPPARIDV